MVASEITPKEDIDVCIAGCIKSVRAGGGSGDIFTNRDLFVMHCDNLRYIVLQYVLTRSRRIKTCVCACNHKIEKRIVGQCKEW